MTRDDGGALGPATPRRLLVLPLLRSTGAAVLLTVLYYVAPLDRQGGVGTTLLLIGGLLAFGALVTWQAVAITASPHPRLRAVEALSTAVPLFLITFSAVYYLMASEPALPFSEPLNRTDALYFTVTVFATVGFGDIAPTSEAARAVTTVQMVADLILVGLIAKVFFGAVRIGLERRRDPARPPGREP
ncbi:potassium channel family protein [Streptomyces sp. SP18CS02]|uniref:potassium channel family protein n=1 Tax=Streptomyces sp. SP18CS02 TaxID=3002531 RepID=UPI002E79FE2C|nr:potassium channel family protein [Streptomyces sp. SP18CS02]MEE1752133.1 potassium channel family protein [Streptomyces sp. SP18CS02]